MAGDNRTLLEWFGCEEGMTEEEIRLRLQDIWDWGMQGLKEAEEENSRLARREETNG